MLSEQTEDNETLKENLQFVLIAVGAVILSVLILISITQVPTEQTRQYVLEVEEVSADATDSSSVVNYETLSERDQKKFREALSANVKNTEGPEIGSKWSGPEKIMLDGKIYSVQSGDGGFSLYGALLFIVGFLSMAIGLVGFVMSFSGVHMLFKSLFAPFSDLLSIIGVFCVLCVFLVLTYFILNMFIFTSVAEPVPTIGQAVEKEPADATIVQVEDLSAETREEFYAVSQTGEEFSTIDYQKDLYIKSDGEFYPVEKRMTVDKFGGVILSVSIGGVLLLWVVSVLSFIGIASGELAYAKYRRNQS